jgi:two-component sensor histidine kinase
MRETHHRVKNNLQVIAGLVDMRIAEGGEMVPMEDLRRVAMHTRTLASVHDLLTQMVSEDEATNYVSSQSILDKLIELMRDSGGGRTFRTHIEDARLTVRQGSSLALVVSEIISNALKHGRGPVEVALTVADDIATLEVCDDGDGFPSGFDVHHSANTGLDIVEQVTRWDLSGHIVYDNRPEGGARVRIQIPTSR